MFQLLALDPPRTPIPDTGRQERFLRLIGYNCKVQKIEDFVNELFQLIFEKYVILGIYLS